MRPSSTLGYVGYAWLMYGCGMYVDVCTYAREDSCLPYRLLELEQFGN